MKHFYIILFLMVSSISAALAQDGYTSLHYDVGFGLGKTSDFISKPSFRGIGFDYRKMVNPNIGVGVSFAWSTFYERKDDDTYTLPDGSATLSGVQFRYLNVLPFHLNFNYYLGGEGETVRPFLGLGVGTVYSEKKTQMGQYANTTQTWHFSLQPEVGVLYEVQPDVSVFIAGKFTTPFDNGSVVAMPFLSMNVGLAWMLH